jgi:hypothetical protein
MTPEEQEIRTIICGALQIVFENRLGGYTVDIYGDRADLFLQWIAGMGYEIVPIDKT